MRFINFKSIKVKNFLSFGNKETKICLFPGVNTIVGTNFDKEDSKNGAGKSSILEALHYCLFGATLREIGKDFVINSVTNEPINISLEFDIVSNNETKSYTIIRKSNPTKCQILENGNDITRSTLAKTNEFIQQLIRTPSTVFQNSIIMSANNAIPFMAMSKTDKRKFIESILGLEVFTSMILKARDEYNSTKKDYEVQYALFEQLTSNLTFNQSQLQNYEENKSSKIQKLQEKQQSILGDIDLLNDKLNKDLPKDLDHKEEHAEINLKLEDTQTKLYNQQSKLHKVEAEIKTIDKQITKLTVNIDHCPTCNRQYEQEHVNHVSESINSLEKSKGLYQQAKLKLVKEIHSIEQNLKLLFSDKQQLDNKIKSNHKLFSDNESINSRVKLLKTNLKEISEEIKSINAEQNNDLKGKIISLEQEKTEKQNKVNELNNNLNVLETVKFVLSEEGIKSFIVKKIKTILNQQLAVYLNKLEANCLCQFNEFFEEEIIDEKGHQKSYFNFSGGERKRIDLACIFAFADVRRLQGDANFSTIFYDELFDSSLDDKGISLCLKVLQDRYSELNESCYVVTHRGLLGSFKPDNTIHVIKRRGVTTLSN